MDLAISHLGLSLLAASLTTLSPCVFPILPMVLGGAAQGNRLAPLAMGVGMALSFAGIGVVIGALGPVAYASRRGFHAVRDKVLALGDKVKKVFGGMIFLAGLAIASGGDKWLEAQIVPLLPEAWLRATTLF